MLWFRFARPARDDGSRRRGEMRRRGPGPAGGRYRVRGAAAERAAPGQGVSVRRVARGGASDACQSAGCAPVQAGTDTGDLEGSPATETVRSPVPSFPALSPCLPCTGREST